MTDPFACAECGNPLAFADGGVWRVVRGAGHVSLHISCWSAWSARCRAERAGEPVQPHGDLGSAEPVQPAGGVGQQPRLGSNDLFGRVPRQDGRVQASLHRAFVAQRPIGRTGNGGE